MKIIQMNEETKLHKINNPANRSKLNKIRKIYQICLNIKKIVCSGKFKKVSETL